MLFEEVIGALRAGRTIKRKDCDLDYFSMQYDMKYDRLRYEGNYWFLVNDQPGLILDDGWEIVE